MAAVVEVWASELAKLKEKVRLRKPFLSSKAKEEEAEDETQAKEATKVSCRDTTTTTMSEDTVLLIMDRFAPL
ncbi:hypothetical protein Tsubulata_030334 [Turnera subulata]|uniref:Uncharacterized protein n=1 Tax=Turnera subulata TaxID=218843 RepID=A0A9Q0G9X3_9ROSI|nr:hypothetical protein Tsubulata_030334 [Turnera subulata]